jgi:hypothetical protein
MTIPEDCPVRDVLKRISEVLGLLNKVLEHCEKCIREREKDERGPSNR